MDRQHRHDLKHDKFVDEIGALSERARQNQRLLLLIAGGLIAVAVLVYGWYFYQDNREENAQELLATAIRTAESPVGTAPPAPGAPAPKYKTEQERESAAEKQFKDVHAKYSGTDAADVASLYLARIAGSRGDAATARKLLSEFADDHSSNILGVSARYSLYQLRIGAGEATQVVTEINSELAKKENAALPTDALLMLLAEAQQKAGNGEKAREALQRLATEFPQSPYADEARRRGGAA